MTTPFTAIELAHLDAHLPSAMSMSMLNGYLAAVSSGPSFVMPDKVLRWVWDAGRADQLTTDLIIRQYQVVNDALNGQVYEPELTNPQAWCRGYLAGFAADMTAWAPLTAAQPELLKVILSNAQDQPLDSAKAALAEAAHRIHAFWLSQRRHGSNAEGLLGQLAAFSPKV
jgi:yecA family protein